MLATYWDQLLTWLKEWALWLVEYLKNFAHDKFAAGLDQMEAALGTVGIPSLTGVKTYLEIANLWLPIDLAFTLGGVFLAVWTVGATIRWIFKCIPTMG